MSIGFLTLDILILLAIFIGTFIFSFNAGKKQIAKFLLTIFPAILIFQNLPFSLKDNMTKSLVFLGIYILIFFLLRRNFTAPSNASGGRKFFDSLVISIASVFILLIIYYRIIPLESFYDLTLPFSKFLIDKIPFYITLLVPIIALVITNRRDD